MNDQNIGTYEWAKRTGGKVSRDERQAIQKAVVEYQALAASRASEQIKDRLKRADLDAIEIPESAIVRDTLEYAESLYPTHLINHCYRTFYWGGLLAQTDRVSIEDHECFFVASILHDLGCVDEHHQSNPGLHCFAVESAFAAETFLTAHGFQPSRSRVAAEAIALHTTGWGIDDRFGAVARYLYAGAACDVMGERSNNISETSAKELLRRFPGAGFGSAFGAFLQREVELRPDSRIAIILTAGPENSSAPSSLFPWATLEMQQ